MDRPGSRGGLAKAPTGNPVPQPDRPSTASRGAQPPMQPAMGGGGILGATGGGIMAGAPGNRPPGTAMRGAVNQPPPGTAYKRLGTASGRPGTGQQGAAGPRTGTAVQVENRPITNHGVSGIKANAGGGGGRRVLDKNYFIGELRQKRSEIASVTSNMQQELDALEKRQTQYNQLEKRNGDLVKEVKLLQEQLADYNTVLDKAASQTSINAINQEVAMLRDRNQAQSKRVDEVVNSKFQVEMKVKAADVKIAEIQASIDTRLNAMPPSQRQQYQDLVAEQQQLQAEAKRFEEVMDDLDRQLQINEGELARNPLKQRSLEMQEQIRKLTETKYELQQEEDRSRMSPEEQKEQLMLKIKKDNQAIEAMTVQLRELQDQNKKMESRVTGMQGQSPAVNAQEEEVKRQKYQELLKREVDLNDFMDSFPSRRAEKVTEMRTKQDSIVQVLERIAKLHTLTSSKLPSQKQLRDMQDELEYKRMQLENTQVTQERLKEELTMRKTELEKIDQLEDKIKQELVQLADKSETLRKNMDDYANVGDMRAKAESSRARLEKLRVQLLRRKDLLRMAVADKALKHQAKKAQLQENNMQITVEKTEQRLKQLMQGVHQMDDFVRTKESEANYKSLAINISQLADELNTVVKTTIM